MGKNGHNQNPPPLCSSWVVKNGASGIPYLVNFENWQKSSFSWKCPDFDIFLLYIIYIYSIFQYIQYNIYSIFLVIVILFLKITHFFLLQIWKLFNNFEKSKILNMLAYPGSKLLNNFLICNKKIKKLCDFQKQNDNQQKYTTKNYQNHDILRKSSIFCQFSKYVISQLYLGPLPTLI